MYADVLLASARHECLTVIPSGSVCGGRGGGGAEGPCSAANLTRKENRRAEKVEEMLDPETASRFLPNRCYHLTKNERFFNFRIFPSQHKSSNSSTRIFERKNSREKIADLDFSEKPHFNHKCLEVKIKKKGSTILKR